MVEVAAAVVQRPDGSFLLGQRPQGKVYAGWWEFPGGKIEAGERPVEAVARELREELGIRTISADPWISRTHVYPHAAVRLNFFRVRRWEGEPAAREHQALHWQQLDEPVVAPMLPANAPVLAALALPDRHGITAAATLGVDRMLVRLEQRFAEGLRLVQIREAGLSTAQRADFASQVVRLARRFGAKVVVNTDLALARSVRADGVHLPASILMALEERPRDLLVGASCHDALELAQACRRELDYAVLGPVKATATHVDAAPMGWPGFADLAHGSTIPLYAIGGLGANDLEDAWRAGAHGLAMIRGLWGD